MAWVSVNKSGFEVMFEEEPIRDIIWCVNTSNHDCSCIGLPEGTIEKLIGKKLTWEDEPVKL